WRQGGRVSRDPSDMSDIHVIRTRYPHKPTRPPLAAELIVNAARTLSDRSRADLFANQETAERALIESSRDILRDVLRDMRSLDPIAVLAWWEIGGGGPVGRDC